MLVGLSYLKFGNTPERPVLMEQCSELYCQIWKEPPWCEDFWVPEEVRQTLSKELELPGAVCVLAANEYTQHPYTEYDDDKYCVLGFTWGYSVSQEDLRRIAGHEGLDFVFENTPRAFYIDELGVDPGKRLKGVGRQLTTLLLDHARGQGHRRIVLRTDLRAVPARALYSHLGFTELDVKDAQHENRTYWLLDL